MNELQLFTHEVFGNVRMANLDGTVYAIGIDIAKMLEFPKPSEAIRINCKSDPHYTGVIDSLGRTQETRIITVGDVVRLIVKAADQSRNENVRKKASQVERWIFDEVIPTVLSQGHYETPEYKALMRLQDQQQLLIEQHTEDQKKIECLQSSVDEIKSNIIFQVYEPPKAKLLSLETRFFCALGQDRHTRKFYDAIMDYTGIFIPKKDDLPKGIHVYEYIFGNIPMNYIQQFVLGIERKTIVKSKAGHWVNLDGYENPVEWNKILNHWNFTCAYCGKSHYDETLVAEHIIPQSQIGVYEPELTSVIGNIVPSCPQCNSSKYTHPMEKWFRHQKFFSEEKLQKILQHQVKYEI